MLFGLESLDMGRDFVEKMVCLVLRFKCMSYLAYRFPSKLQLLCVSLTFVWCDSHRVFYAAICTIA